MLNMHYLLFLSHLSDWKPELFICIFATARQTAALHSLAASGLQLFTQLCPVRTTAGFLNCSRYTCVKLRGGVEILVAIQHCSCTITLVTLMHLSVFSYIAHLHLCMCVYSTHCASCTLGYIVHYPRASCNFFCFLFLCTASSPVSSFPSSHHLFQGQLFSRLTREWYRRLLPRSISSKWSKGEFTLLTFSCTVAVLTFNCLSVFRANSHLVPDNCAIPGLPRLTCHSPGHHLKQPLIA